MTTHQDPTTAGTPLSQSMGDPMGALLTSLLDSHELGPSHVRRASLRRRQRRYAAQARIRRLLA